MLIMSLISHSSFSTSVIFRVLHFCQKVISMLKNSACAMPCGIQSECLWSILDKSSFSGEIKLLLSAESLLSLCFCALRCGSVAKCQNAFQLMAPFLIFVNFIRDGLVFLYAGIPNCLTSL